VVFQNAADQEKLINLGIAEPARTQLIRGSGVDINYFDPDTLLPGLAEGHIASPGDFHTPLRLLFPSRLINEKGVRELLQACRHLWAHGAELELLVAGALDDGNRSSLTSAELAELRAETRIRCLGHVADMRALYASSDLVVLPSWREGLSRALIEAAAMERPIITTDVPGCRDVIDHGRCGLLVPVKNADALRLAIALLLEQPDLARQFGRAARRKVVQEFAVSLVNERTLATYRRLVPLAA